MQASDSVSAVFDDPNLVSVAGLVLALARRAGLHDLAAEHLSVPGRAGANSRVKVTALASMLSAPATIPATNAATFTSALDPADPGTRTWARAKSCSPARSANVMTGIRPAHDTRFGSSKPAERLWQDRIYRMSSCLVRWNPQETPSSQVKRTFVCHDPLRTPPSPVNRGSVMAATLPSRARPPPEG